MKTQVYTKSHTGKSNRQFNPVPHLQHHSIQSARMEVTGNYKIKVYSSGPLSIRQTLINWSKVKKAERGTIAACQYLQEGYQEDGAKLLTDVQCGKTRDC